MVMTEQEQKAVEEAAKKHELFSSIRGDKYSFVKGAEFLSNLRKPSEPEISVDNRAKIMELLWVFSCDGSADPKVTTEELVRLAQNCEPERGITITNVSEPSEDAIMIDWIQHIMTQKEGYCEVYLAGLRDGNNDATAFQIESNPEVFPVLQGKSVRECISEAISCTNKMLAAI